jgi:hypothetical protein
MVTRKAKVATNQARTRPAGEAASPPQPATTAVTIQRETRIRQDPLSGSAGAQHPTFVVASRDIAAADDRGHPPASEAFAVL